MESVKMKNERALSQKQAWACEYALESRCRCRCNGALHGAKRVKYVEHLAELPADDPHHQEPEEDPSKKLKHPAWLRRVVRVTKERARMGPHWAKRLRLVAECGHVSYVKSSRGEPRKVHCVTCYRAGKAAAIAAAALKGTQLKTVARSSDSF